MTWKKLEISLLLALALGLQYSYIIFDQSQTLSKRFPFNDIAITNGVYVDYICRDLSYCIFVFLIFDSINEIRRFRNKAVLFSFGYVVDFMLFYNDPIPGLWKVTYGWVLAIAVICMFYSLSKDGNN